MSFEQVLARSSPQPETLAFVQLKLRGRLRSRPAFLVTIRKHLLDELKWPNGTPLGLWVGSGGDDGKIMLSTDTRGHAIAKVHGIGKGGTNGALVDLGYLSSFGMDGRLKLPVDAVIAGGDLIIGLPGGSSWRDEWTAIINRDEVEKPTPPKPLSPGPKPAPPRPASSVDDTAAKKIDPPRAAAPDLFKPKKEAAVAAAPKRSNVTLSQRFAMKVTSDPFQIINAGAGGGCYECNDVQAGILATLVAVSPGLLVPSDIVKRAYPLVGRKVTSGSEGLVDYEVRQLQPKLLAIGVKLTHTKGMGYSISTTD